jgi:NDP-sugar pyrophosphorylase family protein
MRAVVLAGGRGSRLLPYTSVLPKPLMPIGDRTVLEIVLDSLHSQGFTEVTLCVGYLSHLIRAVVDDGRVDGGMRVAFVQEAEPLGTAGPLRLVPDLDSTFVAMNGDVLTSLDLRRLVGCHLRHRNVLTIAVNKRAAEIDYGILSLDGAGPHDPTAPDGAGAVVHDPSEPTVVAYEEKPQYELNVSMGIYVMEPNVRDWIPEGYFDFPDLVRALLQDELRVGAYVHDGYWLDIGRRDDYERAVEELLAPGGGTLIGPGRDGRE